MQTKKTVKKIIKNSNKAEKEKAQVPNFDGVGYFDFGFTMGTTVLDFSPRLKLAIALLLRKEIYIVTETKVPFESIMKHVAHIPLATKAKAGRLFMTGAEREMLVKQTLTNKLEKI